MKFNWFQVRLIIPNRRGVTLSLFQIFGFAPAFRSSSTIIDLLSLVARIEKQ